MEKAADNHAKSGRRGRFAPTPSGNLHAGNALSAMLAWLQMRSAGGRFILRIEDIDKPRSKPAFERQLIDDLIWLGLDWDEGPGAGGPYGPYRQSERLGLYESAFRQLMDVNRLYPCFCSRAKLMEIASAPHGLSSEGPVYPGLCRNLTAEEQAKKAKHKQPSFRFKMDGENIAYTDGIAGNQSVPGDVGGDFVVKRADGIMAYQLAVVVDDAAMGITDVFRGRDLLDSTPRQIRLYEALGLPVPRFAHHPLLFGPDGQRLSKRHGAVALTELRAAGAQPEVIIGRLAFLSGLTDRPEPVWPHDLLPEFRLSQIPHTPIRLSADDLTALSGERNI